MRSAIGIILLVLLTATLAQAAISIVQLPVVGDGCGENQGGASINIGTPNTIISSKDILVLLVGGITSSNTALYGFGTVTGITNGTGAAGIVWHQVPNAYGCDANGGCSDVWYGTNLSNQRNGANITVNTTSTDDFVGACLMEVTGQATSNVVDSANNNGHKNSVTTLVTPAIQGNSQSELFIAEASCAQTGNATTAVGGITFTAINGGTGNGVGGCPAGYYISSAMGPVQAGLVQSPAGTGETTIVSFAAAGAGETSYGSGALHSNTTGIDNTAIGNSALFRNITGSRNTSLGFDALYGNVSGSNNSAVGYQVLLGNTTGSFNLGMGWQALRNLTTGSSNIGLGFNAGQGIVTGSNNIDIAGSGSRDESNTIRIGTVGTQAAAYIAGINTARVSGSTVEVNSQGRLGVTLSSARYKRDIHNMSQASAGLLKLRPVTFHYKDDPSRTLQYGLVAEQVAKHYPELVTYGADGKIQSVRYLELTAMLLNELQKQVRDTQHDRKTIQQLQLKHQSLAAQLAEAKVENARELSTVQNVLSRLSVLEHTVQTAGAESRPALSARLQTIGREQP